MSLYSAQVFITDCMKVKYYGVRMASSDMTSIKTGSIAPRHSACHHCMQTGGKMPLPKPTQCIRDVVGHRVRLDVLENSDSAMYGATIPRFSSPQPRHEGPTQAHETTFNWGSQNVFRDLHGGEV
jgi:hypothetical protein